MENEDGSFSRIGDSDRRRKLSECLSDGFLSIDGDLDAQEFVETVERRIPTGRLRKHIDRDLGASSDDGDEQPTAKKAKITPTPVDKRCINREGYRNPTTLSERLKSALTRDSSTPLAVIVSPVRDQSNRVQKK